MRTLIALIGLLILGPNAFAGENSFIASITYSNSNVYKISSKSPVLVNLLEKMKIERNEFSIKTRDDSQEETYVFSCLLHAGSKIRFVKKIIRDNREYLLAEVLMSSAWEDDNFQGGSAQGACNREKPEQRSVIFPPEILEAFFKQRVIRFAEE